MDGTGSHARRVHFPKRRLVLRHFDVGNLHDRIGSIFWLRQRPSSGFGGDWLPTAKAFELRSRKVQNDLFFITFNNFIFSYDVMIQCWQTAPSDRPTFAQLRSRLEKLMECSEQRLYLELV